MRSQPYPNQQLRLSSSFHCLHQSILVVPSPISKIADAARTRSGVVMLNKEQLDWEGQLKVCGWQRGGVMPWNAAVVSLICSTRIAAAVSEHYSKHWCLTA